jgi:phenylpyruvate tautomerase PptA (4-oxalocrotonate tautomerase family)
MGAVPVVEIRALPQPGVEIELVLHAVTHAVAAVLGEEPRGSWATWEEIPAGRYSEGGDAPAEQPRSTHPPLVRVIAFKGRPPELVAKILTAVADVLARELRLEQGNVFVKYEMVSPGELYTGGSVR